MLTRSYPSASIGADYISTVCATKFQMRPTPTSIQISAHLLEPLRRDWAFRRLWYFIHPLGLVLSWEPKAGGRGWSGVRDTVKSLLNYSFLSAENWMREPSSRRKEEQKMLPICGEKICLTSDCSCRQLLNRYPWSPFALCVSVYKFCVSFCLIRNLTMFSLVKRLKQWRSQWCFSSLFSLKRYQLALHTFFSMSPWHLNYSESTLWNLRLKKPEAISIPVPQETPVCLEPL